MHISDIESLLYSFECPLCSAKDLDLKLRCDLDYHHCLSTVQCRRCGYEFEAKQLVNSANGGQQSDPRNNP